jgi:hypothetical protein
MRQEELLHPLPPDVLVEPPKMKLGAGVAVAGDPPVSSPTPTDPPWTTQPPP